MAKDFKRINELTPENLRLFIQRIETEDCSKKHSCNTPQSIRAVYRKIGDMDIAAQKPACELQNTPQNDGAATLTA